MIIIIWLKDYNVENHQDSINNPLFLNKMTKRESRVILIYKDGDNMKEIWLVCKENQNYMVSSFGRVYSIISKKYLKLSETDKGYLYVNLQNKKYKVHRLVANNFLINIFEKETVNHKDRNKKNNFLYNLEWATQKENNEHKQQTNYLYTKPPIKQRGIRTSSPKEILQYDLNGNFLREFPSINAAAKITNSIRTKIGDCVNEVLKQHNNFIWKLKTEKYSKKIEPYTEKFCGEKVICQYTINGIFVKEYKSVTIAAKETGYKLKGISAAATNQRKTHRNFIWKYK